MICHQITEDIKHLCWLCKVYQKAVSKYKMETGHIEENILTS